MEPMDVSDIRVQQNAELGGYEAKVSGHWLTNGDGGHFIEVTGWGNTEARARQEPGALPERARSWPRR